MKKSIRTILSLFAILTTTCAEAQELVVEAQEVIAEAAVVDGDVILVQEDGQVDVVEIAGEVVAEAEAALAVEEDVAVFEEDGENVIGQAIGGFIRAIGVPLVGPKGQGPPPNDVYSKDVDKIESEVELRELERQLKRDNNVKQIHPRIKQQVDNTRDLEIEFLHLACNLKRSEFNEIEKAAKAICLRVLVKQCQAYGRQFRGRNRRLNTSMSTPQNLIAEEVANKATAILGEDRIANYKRELELREKFRKEAVIGTLASGLDSMLHFEKGQRSKVKEVLASKWQDSWNMQFQYFGNIEYIGGLPNKDIKTLLTDEQTAIFDSINWQPQNVQQFFWNNQIDLFGFAQRNRGRLATKLKFAPEEETPQ